MPQNKLMAGLARQDPLPLAVGCGEELQDRPLHMPLQKTPARQRRVLKKRN
jgi:hypothetical protein